MKKLDLSLENKVMSDCCCALPSCKSQDSIAFSVGGSIDTPSEEILWWCADHVLDSWLPALENSSVERCVVCSELSDQALGRTPLHKECRRTYMISDLRPAPKGAYGRKALNE